MAGLGLGFSGAAGGVYDARNEGFDQSLRARALALQEDRVRQEMKLQEEDRQLRIQEAVRAAEKEKYARFVEQGNYGFDEPGGQAPTPVAGVRSIAEPEGPRAGAPPGGLPGPRPITAVSAIEQFTGEPLVPEGPRAGAPAGGLPQNTQPAAQAAPGGTVDAGLVSQYRPAAPGPAGQPGRFQVPASMTMHGLKLGDQELVPDQEVPIPTRAQRRARMYQDAIDKFFTTPQTSEEGKDVYLGGELMFSGGRKKAPGFEGEYIARLEEKLGRPLSFEEFAKALGDYKAANTDPSVVAQRALAGELAQERMRTARTKQDGNRAQAIALIEGRLVPSQLKGRETFGDVVRIADEESMARTGKPYDFRKAELDYFGTRRFVSGQNSERRQVYRTLATTVVNTIDEMKALAEELKQGGVQKFNQARRNTILQVYGNTPLSDIAARYLAAANTLKEEYANLAMGGYAPTESAWALSHQVVNTDYGVADLTAGLDEVQKLINYRVAAYDELEPYTLGSSNGFTVTEVKK